MIPGINPDFQRRMLAGGLADADATFAETGDVMLALDWIARAATADIPLPPAIGAWLRQAVDDYLYGKAATMDTAMGLALKGKAQPRRRRRTENELNHALGRMWSLIQAGATRTQAAVLVAALTGRQVEQLLRSYGGSFFADRSSGAFEDMSAEDMRTFAVETLATYPDDEQTRQEKAAILKMHDLPAR